MPGCATKCTEYRTDSRDNAWTDIRAHFGPVVAIGSDIYNEDISEWNTWAAANGYDPVTDVEQFGKWFIWRCSYGTANYGNLPTRIRDHEGISCITCPYDSNSSEIHTRLWLGLEDTDPLPTQNDHGSYFLKVANQGGRWGFECTSPTCPYYTTNGVPYFHA